MEKLIKIQGDPNKPWCIMKEPTGNFKINKSSLASKIITPKSETLDETNIANKINIFLQI